MLYNERYAVQGIIQDLIEVLRVHSEGMGVQIRDLDKYETF